VDRREGKKQVLACEVKTKQALDRTAINTSGGKFEELTLGERFSWRWAHVGVL